MGHLEYGMDGGFGYHLRRHRWPSSFLPSRDTHALAVKNPCLTKFPRDGGKIQHAGSAALEPVKDLADQFHVVGRATGGFGESFRQQSVFKLPLLLREGFMNGDAFIERADSDPKRSFQRIRMGRRKALGRKAVADLTVELDEFALSSLIKRSIAFRAHERHGIVTKARLFRLAHVALVSFLFSVFLRQSNRGVGQFHQQCWHLCQRHAMVHVHIAQGTPWHAGVQSFKGILHNGDATATFDGEKSCRSVIQSPRG